MVILGQIESSPPTTKLLAPDMLSPEETNDAIIQTSKFIETVQTPGNEGIFEFVVEQLNGAQSQQRRHPNAQVMLNIRTKWRRSPNQYQASLENDSEAKTQNWVKSMAMLVSAAICISFGTTRNVEEKL